MKGWESNRFGSILAEMPIPEPSQPILSLLIMSISLSSPATQVPLDGDYFSTFIFLINKKDETTQLSWLLVQRKEWRGSLGYQDKKRW